MGVYRDLDGVEVKRVKMVSQGIKTSAIADDLYGSGSGIGTITARYTKYNVR